MNGRPASKSGARFSTDRSASACSASCYGENSAETTGAFRRLALHVAENSRKKRFCSILNDLFPASSIASISANGIFDHCDMSRRTRRDQPLLYMTEWTGCSVAAECGSSARNPAISG